MSLSSYHARTSIEVSDIARAAECFEGKLGVAALRADRNGIHELGDGRIAWFRYPDADAFAIEERTAP
jgi:hypothetical protein